MSSHITCPDDAVFPADLLGRRDSLQDLVEGVLDPLYQLNLWLNDLQRCFFSVSRNPFQPILLRNEHSRKEPIALERWIGSVSSLQSDLKNHGLGCFLSIRTIVMGNAVLSDVFSKLTNTPGLTKFRLIFGWSESEDDYVTLGDDLTNLILEDLEKLLSEFKKKKPDLSYLDEYLNYKNGEKQLEFFLRGLLAALPEALPPKLENLRLNLGVYLRMLRNYETAIASPARQLMELAKAGLWDIGQVAEEIEGLQDEKLIAYLALREENPYRNITCYAHTLVHPIEVFGGYGLSANASEEFKWRVQRSFSGTVKDQIIKPKKLAHDETSSPPSRTRLTPRANFFRFPGLTYVSPAQVPDRKSV